LNRLVVTELNELMTCSPSMAGQWGHKV